MMIHIVSFNELFIDNNSFRSLIGAFHFHIICILRVRHAFVGL